MWSTQLSTPSDPSLSGSTSSYSDPQPQSMMKIKISHTNKKPLNKLHDPMQSPTGYSISQKCQDIKKIAGSYTGLTRSVTGNSALDKLMKFEKKYSTANIGDKSERDIKENGIQKKHRVQSELEFSLNSSSSASEDKDLRSGDEITKYKNNYKDPRNENKMINRQENLNAHISSKEKLYKHFKNNNNTPLSNISPILNNSSEDKSITLLQDGNRHDKYSDLKYRDTHTDAIKSCNKYIPPESPNSLLEISEELALPSEFNEREQNLISDIKAALKSPILNYEVEDFSHRPRKQSKSEYLRKNNVSRSSVLTKIQHSDQEGRKNDSISEYQNLDLTHLNADLHKDFSNQTSINEEIHLSQSDNVSTHLSLDDNSSCAINKKLINKHFPKTNRSEYIAGGNVKPKPSISRTDFKMQESIDLKTIKQIKYNGNMEVHSLKDIDDFQNSDSLEEITNPFNNFHNKILTIEDLVSSNIEPDSAGEIGYNIASKTSSSKMSDVNDNSSKQTEESLYRVMKNNELTTADVLKSISNDSFTTRNDDGVIDEEIEEEIFTNISVSSQYLLNKSSANTISDGGEVADEIKGEQSFSIKHRSVQNKKNIRSSHSKPDQCKQDRIKNSYRSVTVQTDTHHLTHILNEQVLKPTNIHTYLRNGNSGKILDPHPIIHYSVEPEVIEAMAAQNPMETALNEIVKQQIDLTRHFMSAQNAMYEAYTYSVSQLTANYKPVTLENTKKFIEKYRKSKHKPQIISS